MRLAGWMATTGGRASRAGAGLLLIGGGAALGGAGGLALALVGLVPLVVAAADLCLLAPLLGAPLRGGRKPSA